MHTPTPAQIATARAVVTHPAQFADQLALRENAWRTLVEARGGTMAANNLPIVTHAQPGHPARGVAAHLADRLTRDTRPAPAELTVADCVARARPAILAAIARREARARQRQLEGQSV